MIRTIEEARQWYLAVKTLADDMKRLAGKWDDPGLKQVLSRDKRFRDRTSADLIDKANTVLEDLDHLAVLLLFSVFEATVRARAQADVERETTTLRHPAVLSAIKNLQDSIKNGSFAKVTEAYKAMDVELTTQVNQVRDFRNWVAHGRRDGPKINIDPESAIDRLQRYLTRLAEVEEAGTISFPLTEPDPELPPNL